MKSNKTLLAASLSALLATTAIAASNHSQQLPPDGARWSERNDGSYYNKQGLLVTPNARRQTAAIEDGGTTIGLGSTPPQRPNPAITGGQAGGANTPPTAPSPANTSGGQSINADRTQEEHEDGACPVQQAAEETQAQMTEIVLNTPKRTDIMKDLEKKETTKGCLTSSKEILDLSMTLPTIKGSWGSIGTIIQKRAEAEIKRLKNHAIDRACAIADQAIYDVMSPIKDTVRRINDFGDVVSNAPEILADHGVKKVNRLSDKVFGVLDRYENKASEQAQRASDSVLNKLNFDKINNEIDDASMELGFENIGDAAEYARNIHVSNALTLYKDLQDKVPAKPAYTVSRSMKGDTAGEMMRCTGAKCEKIDLKEYERIQKQWADYNRAMDEYGPQVEAAREMYLDALKEMQGREQARSENPDTGTIPTSEYNKGQGTVRTRFSEKINEVAEKAYRYNVDANTLGIPKPTTNKPQTQQSGQVSTGVTQTQQPSGQTPSTNGKVSQTGTGVDVKLTTTNGTQTANEAPKAPNPFAR